MGFRKASGVSINRTASTFSTVRTPVMATGGTITTYTLNGAIYRVHSFLSGTSTLTVTVPGYVDALIVGGGGGGGSNSGSGAGGGGGGQVVQLSSLYLAPGAYTVIVGAGGVGTYLNPTCGGTSYLGSITAIGGGKGGSVNPGATAWLSSGDGASSGGRGNDAGTRIGDAYAGNVGGANGTTSGGGGGGSGSVGGAASGATGGSGGSGTASTLRDGTSQTYGGGGGGQGSTTGGSASGGGGAGASGNVAGTAGTANSGGGGGGSGGSSNGAAGGSGIVVVRYQIN